MANRMQYEEQYQCECDDEGGVNNAVLESRATRGLRVRHPREGDHGVEREVNSGQRGFEEVIEFFLGPECFRCGLVAHLDNILQGESGQRVAVYFSALDIFGEGTMSILRKSREAFVEHDAIFKRRIHS